MVMFVYVVNYCKWKSTSVDVLGLAYKINFLIAFLNFILKIVSNWKNRS